MGLPQLSLPQMMVGRSAVSTHTSAAGGYVFANAEASALVARFTTPPTRARKALIDTLVGSLKTAGVWSKMDALYVMAAADAQAAQRNWIADAFNLTPNSAPTFAADRGYTPNGTTSYLDTGFNPSTAPTPKLTQNDAHMFIWSRTNLRNAGTISYDAGNGNSRVTRRGNVDAPTGSDAAVAANMTSQVVLTPNAYPGHVGWSRSGAALWEGYTGGVDIGGGTTASAAALSENFGIGRIAAGQFGLNQIAAYHFGSNLTAGEVLATYNALNTYMTAVGAA